jgi:hypothetical protein
MAQEMGTSAAPPVALRVKNVRYCRVCLSRVEAGERVPAVCPSCRWPGSWYAPFEVHQARYGGSQLQGKKAPDQEALHKAVWGDEARYAAIHDGSAWRHYEDGRWGHAEAQVGMALTRDRTALELANIDPEGPTLRRTKIPLEQVLLARVVVETNDQTVTTATTETANRGSTLGRAAAGGFLFGGAGAVVGALSAGSKQTGSTTSQTKTESWVKHVFLEVHVDGPAGTTHRVDFFDGGYRKSISKAEDLIGQAHAWVERIDRAMKNKTQPLNRIQELERLSTLRTAGHLTDEEYAAEKQRLLGGD